MMPNLFKYPVILIPCLSTLTILPAIQCSAILSKSVLSHNLQGSIIVGLVGPLAIDAGLNVACSYCMVRCSNCSSDCKQNTFENVLKIIRFFNGIQIQRVINVIPYRLLHAFAWRSLLFSLEDGTISVIEEEWSDENSTINLF